MSNKVPGDMVAPRLVEAGGGVEGRHTLESTVLKHFVLNFIVLYSIGNIWGKW